MTLKFYRSGATELRWNLVTDQPISKMGASYGDEISFEITIDTFGTRSSWARIEFTDDDIAKLVSRRFRLLRERIDELQAELHREKRNSTFKDAVISRKDEFLDAIYKIHWACTVDSKATDKEAFEAIADLSVAGGFDADLSLYDNLKKFRSSLTAVELPPWAK